MPTQRTDHPRLATPQPILRWLVLGTAVLLLHLALLQSLPMQLSLAHQDTAQSTSTAWHFAARAVPTLAPPPPAAPRPKSIPRPTALAAQPKPPVAAPQAAINAAPNTAQDATPNVTAMLPQNAASAAPSSTEALRVLHLPKTDPAPPESAPTSLTTLASPQSPPSATAPDEPSAPATSALPIAEAKPEPPTPPEAPANPAANALPALMAVQGVPQSVKLLYQVKANKFPFSLSGELVWRLTDNTYQASLSFGAFGQTRTQTSRGQVNAMGLAPERFSDKFRSEVAAHFNRSLGKVTFSANTPDVPLQAGAQDRLSVLIQLAAMAASAPDRFNPATTISIQTIGARSADLWLFTVGERETLTLPNGALEGLKLSRKPRQLYDQQVDIWLAPQLGYLPARIRIQEANGDYIDQQWVASEDLPTP